MTGHGEHIAHVHATKVRFLVCRRAECRGSRRKNRINFSSRILQLLARPSADLIADRPKGFSRDAGIRTPQRFQQIHLLLNTRLTFLLRRIRS